LITAEGLAGWAEHEALGWAAVGAGGHAPGPLPPRVGARELAVALPMDHARRVAGDHHRVARQLLRRRGGQAHHHHHQHHRHRRHYHCAAMCKQIK
jgi:hypothetical protein